MSKVQLLGDHSLVAAAKRGESSAFEDLCKRHKQMMMRAAFRITRQREDAEDAVQDSLLRAFVHLHDFDGRSSFSTWLTRIAINSSLMILRKKRSMRELPIDMPADVPKQITVFELVDPALTPEKLYVQNERVDLLTQAIGALRPPMQKIIQLRQLQEQSTKRTAKTLGISVGAAKARLFHAKRVLRKSPLLRAISRNRAIPRVDRRQIAA